MQTDVQKRTTASKIITKQDWAGIHASVPVRVPHRQGRAPRRQSSDEIPLALAE